MMDLGDLAIFRAVVREGGVTRAADKLHRVQSNVTTRIRQLETELGVELFIREGKRMIVSPAGRILVDYADRLLALAEEAHSAVSDGTPRGRLRLGSMESTAAARLPALLARFHCNFPEVRLELRTGPTAALVAEVIDGRLDCALVGGPVDDPRLDTRPVFTEELVLVAPPAHGPIRNARDVTARTLLTFEPGCAYRQRLESWLAASGVVAERVVELSSYYTMISCAASGMGIALVPRSLLALMPIDKAVTIHTLPPRYAHAPTLLVHRAGQPSAAVRAMAELIEDAQQAIAPPRQAA
jgi:DNA-binding transcriptional LysR family regulator